MYTCSSWAEALDWAQNTSEQDFVNAVSQTNLPFAKSSHRRFEGFDPIFESTCRERNRSVVFFICLAFAATQSFQLWWWMMSSSPAFIILCGWLGSKHQLTIKKKKKCFNRKKLIFSSSLQLKSLVVSGAAFGHRCCHLARWRGQRCKMFSARLSGLLGSWPQEQVGDGASLLSRFMSAFSQLSPVRSLNRTTCCSLDGRWLSSCSVSESPRAHLHVVRMLRFMSLTYKPSELVHFFLFCSCVCFCLYGPFNCIYFHKSSPQSSAFSLCSSRLISALLVLSTIDLFMKVWVSLI